MLRVVNVSDVNLLERILIRSQDGQLQEVACVRYTESDGGATLLPTDLLGGGPGRIKIRHDLTSSFPSDSEIIQGVSIEDREIITTLSSPAKSGQRVLTVNQPERIDPLQQVMIQSPDGQRFEAYCLRSLERNRIVLSEELDFDYPDGSRIIQCRAAEELIAGATMLQRSAICCCCCEAGGVLPVAWFWFIPGGIAPFIPFLLPNEPASDLELPPTPIVP